MSSVPLIEEDQPIYGVAECGIFVNPAIFSRNIVHPSPSQQILLMHVIGSMVIILLYTY